MSDYIAPIAEPHSPPSGSGAYIPPRPPGYVPPPYVPPKAGPADPTKSHRFEEVQFWYGQGWAGASCECGEDLHLADPTVAEAQRAWAEHVGQTS
jgi:hypothetical protein